MVYVVLFRVLLTIMFVSIIGSCIYSLYNRGDKFFRQLTKPDKKENYEPDPNYYDPYHYNYYDWLAMDELAQPDNRVELQQYKKMHGLMHC